MNMVYVCMYVCIKQSYQKDFQNNCQRTQRRKSFHQFSNDFASMESAVIVDTNIDGYSTFFVVQLNNRNFSVRNSFESTLMQAHKYKNKNKKM